MNIPDRGWPTLGLRGRGFGYTGVYLLADVVEADGLAGVLADDSAGRAGGGGSGVAGTADRVLDRVFTLAVEIPRRSGRGLTNRSAPNRVGILCSGRAGFT